MLNVQELSNALADIEVEPRHQDSKLLKIKKALEADYQKNLLENVDMEELNLLKLYLNRIIDGSNLTLDEISKILNEYIEETKVEPYANVVEKIKEDLNSKAITLEQFFEFIEKFVVQNYPIDVFYNKFFKTTISTSPLKKITKPINQPQISLTDLFGDELEDLSSESEDEETKLEKVRTKIEEIREEPRLIQLIEPKPPKQLGKVAVIQDVPIPRPRVPEPKPITDRIFFESMVDLNKQDCEFLYKKIPWVKDIINHIYIHPIEGNFDGIIDFNKYIELNGVKFYQPKEKYYYIQCHSHKIQNGNELTIIKNSITYKLMVAIDTNTKGIVLQNEDMLKAEIDYIRVWNQNKNDHIKELKKNEPNEDMILLAKFDLSNAIQDSITGTVPMVYRSIKSPFINTVVQTILKNSNSGDSFVRLLANIIIFLKINLSFVSSSVFVKRLKEQVYLPGTLPFLTDADKLPEIFMVKNVPEDTKNFVLSKLEEERINFTKDFFENLHIGTSMIRKPTKPILWNKPTQQIELPDIKMMCKNREEISTENDEDIVFYTDLDEVYCFNVYKLYDLFQTQEMPINPYTGRPFSDKFIQIFLTRYASKPLVRNIEHAKHPDLTSKLEDLIEKELNVLENNLIETENPAFIEKFKTSMSPNIKAQQAQSLKNSDKETPGQNQPEKCMECKSMLNSDKIGSVFRNKEVFFCGYDCLEKNKAFK
jgi:hypothetical protein